ncbi:MAG: asparagine synthase (glutamine-hydrolyzing) [Candidatus Brocadiia bacterium]
MCGICGRVNFDGSPVPEELVRKMCGLIRHRGPDSEGVYLSANGTRAGLGIRRLAIIDLQTGDQPIHNEDKTIWLVLNGEIYNFDQLRAELQAKGHRFYTKTDTETIVHLYEEYGTDCLKHLRGMFAFALWDNKKQQLFLARDRVGKKPLLYAHGSKYLIFGSELKSILANPEIKKDIDVSALDHYLTYGYIPAPMSVFKGIKKLPPASWLVCDAAGNITTGKYWQLDYRHKLELSEAEYSARIMELLEESTRIRMISDVPLGALLSGGIDSSAVVGLMARHSSKPVKTFSIGFEEKDFSELAYARAVAEHFNTEHHEFIVRPDVIEILPKLVWHYSEPYADSSMLPTYYVARETRKHVTVALNGDGGDENFAGYQRYLAHKLASMPLYRLAGKPFNNLLNTVFPGYKPRTISGRLKRFTEAAGLTEAQRYLSWCACFNDAARHSLYSDDFSNRTKGAPAENYLLNCINQSPADNIIDRVLYADINTYLPEDLLVKMDIATMANSLEGRSPFLDHKLLELSASIPAGLKIKGLTTKYILKKALKGFLPDEILSRGKMGFGIPIGNWFRTSLKDYLKDIILSERSIKRGYFRREAVENLINSHASGKYDHTPRLWALLVLETWHRVFMD